MKYYPVFLDVKAKKCLVVGGGPVGARKAFMLGKCGARVKVVSDAFCEAFDNLPDGEICLEKRPYGEQDLKDAFLVFAATSDPDLNRRIKKEAEAMSVLCNIADDPDAGSFILPSVVRQGDLILAVSTCGASPAMAKTIRKDLETMFGPEYAKVLVLMKAVRQKLLASGRDPEGHRKQFHALIDKGILTAVKEKNAQRINAILKEVLGSGYTYENLTELGTVNES